MDLPDIVKSLPSQMMESIKSLSPQDLLSDLKEIRSYVMGSKPTAAKEEKPAASAPGMLAADVQATKSDQKDTVLKSSYLSAKNHVSDMLRHVTAPSGISSSEIKAVRKHLDLEDSFQTELMKTVKVSAKALKATESMETSLGGVSLVLMKDRKGRVDVLVKGDKLGAGAGGVAHRAISAISKKEFALKQLHAQATEMDIADIENEAHILKHLNADKKTHEGVPGIITLTTHQSSDGKMISRMTKSDLYKRSDFQSEVERSRTFQFFSMSPEELRKMPPDQLKMSCAKKGMDKLVDLEQNLRQLIKKRESLSGQVASLEERINEGRNSLKQSVSAMDRQIRNINPEISNLIQDLSEPIISQYVAFGGSEEGKKKTEEEIAKFRNGCHEIIAEITSSKEIKWEELDERIEKLFMPEISKLAAASQRVPVTSPKQRCLLASNVVSGMRHAHSKEIVHGDIKPGNVFWDGTKAFLADYGGAKMKNTMGQVQYTKAYSSGEYLQAQVYFQKNNDPENWFRAGQANDMRAMGLTIYEMVTGSSIQGFDKKGDSVAQELEAAHVDKRAIELILRMTKIIDFKPPPPTPFPVPLTDGELEELSALLKKD